jgi:hypothetical protein
MLEMNTNTPILPYNPLVTSVPPGSPALAPGYFLYWSSIENLTGSNVATDLSAQDISFLPTDTLIEVVILDRGASQWLRVYDNSGTAVTDVNTGIIVPANYDAILRPYILKRQIGF